MDPELTILDPNTHREVPVAALAMTGTAYQAKALIHHIELNFAPSDSDRFAEFERITKAMLDAQSEATLARIQLAVDRFEQEAAAKPNDDRAARRVQTAKAVLAAARGVASAE